MPGNYSPMGGGYTSSYSLQVTDQFSKPLEQFSKKMAQVEKQAAKISHAVEKQFSFKQMGNSFSSLGGKLSRYITLPLLALGGLALKAHSDFESLENSLRHFTGSGEVAAKIMGELEKASDRSIFKLREYADSARILLQVGESADTVSGKVKKLADVAATFNLPLEFLAKQLALSKQAPGSPLDPRTINILARQGVPVYKELAKYVKQVTGRKFSEAQIKKFAQEGRISAKAFQGLVEQMTGKGGIAFKGMEEKTKTLEGAFISLKNAGESSLKEVGKTLSESLGLTSKLNDASQHVNNFTNKFKEYALNNPNTIKNLTILIGSLAGVSIALKAIGAAMTLLSLHPLVLAASAIAAAVALIYANKTAIEGNFNAIDSARNKSYSDLGMTNYSKARNFGATESLVAREQGIQADAWKAKMQMNINLFDPGNNVKSIQTQSLGVSQMNTGVNGVAAPQYSAM